MFVRIIMCVILKYFCDNGFIVQNESQVSQPASLAIVPGFTPKRDLKLDGVHVSSSFRTK